MSINNPALGSSKVKLSYMGEILYVDIKIANEIDRINKEEQNLLRRIRRHEIPWSNFNFQFSRTKTTMSIVEKEVILNIQIEKLQEIFIEMPSNSVKILLDKHYHNMTYSEISKELGMPLSTIYYKINRIRNDVLEKLKSNLY